MLIYKVKSPILHQLIILWLNEFKISYTKPKRWVLQIECDFLKLPQPLKEIFETRRFLKEIKINE